ncbi:type IV secretory pathway TrbL component [Kitasatospora sp. MAA19]|nr:type IV secretory pathway TrbL component [Kitasatospora sp. MAA19]
MRSSAATASTSATPSSSTVRAAGTISSTAPSAWRACRSHSHPYSAVTCASSSSSASSARSPTRRTAAGVT